MLDRLRRSTTFANVCSLLALTVAVGTGGAYAANTVFSSDIVDGQVQTADLADSAVTGAKIASRTVANGDLATDAVTTGKIAEGGVTNPDIMGNAVTGTKVAANTLKGADVDESSLAVTQGAGTRVISNRIVEDANSGLKTLLTIPKLGDVNAECSSGNAVVSWFNSMPYAIDSWADYDTMMTNFGQTTPPGMLRIIGQHNAFSGDPHHTELTLGHGDAPAPTRTAIVEANVLSFGAGAPCSMQATVTYWESAP